MPIQVVWPSHSSKKSLDSSYKSMWPTSLERQKQARAPQNLSRLDIQSSRLWNQLNSIQTILKSTSHLIKLGSVHNWKHNLSRFNEPSYLNYLAKLLNCPLQQTWPQIQSERRQSTTLLTVFVVVVVVNNKEAAKSRTLIKPTRSRKSRLEEQIKREEFLVFKMVPFKWPYDRFHFKN